MAEVGELGKLFDEWQKSQPWRVPKKQVAEKIGVARTAIDDWRTGTMPRPQHLAALAREMHYPYRKLLDAALADQGYLPEPDMLRRKVRQHLLDRGLAEHFEAEVEADDDTPASGSA